MSKITIAGNAVIVTAETTLSDLLKIQKYKPEALILMGGEDNKEPVFRILPKPGCAGSIDRNGAVFGAETHDAAKKAVITLGLTDPTDDIVGLVADKLGSAVTALNKLEATFPSVLQQIDADRAAIMASIQVIG